MQMLKEKPRHKDKKELTKTTQSKIETFNASLRLACQLAEQARQTPEIVDTSKIMSITKGQLQPGQMIFLDQYMGLCQEGYFIQKGRIQGRTRILLLLYYLTIQVV
jgi:hypothetical protein